MGVEDKQLLRVPKSTFLHLELSLLGAEAGPSFQYQTQNLVLLRLLRNTALYCTIPISQVALVPVRERCIVRYASDCCHAL